MNLYSLTSDLHGEFTMPSGNERFIQQLEAALGQNFVHKNGDFSTYGNGDDVIYVRTGGTEGIFKSIFCRDGKLSVPGGKVRLLTSGKSNSLAASMEILSYLCQHGVPAEIIHGDAEQMASALLSSTREDGFASQRTPLRGSKVLEGKRLGVVGRPSDWLISSDVDYSRARQMLGVEIVDIPMNELLEEYASGVMEEVPALEPLNLPKFGKPISEDTFRGALLVYSALKRIRARYSLDGLTIRCFDLLTAIGNTGCMALALLNSEDVIGTCEGDVPAMLTMAAANAVTGEPCFQVNLSKAEGEDLLFAHCTIPLSMTRGYVYDSHFESGIGVAVHGIVPEGPATIVKIGSDLTHFIARDVELVSNQYESNLCRTQVVVRAEGLKDYMLHEPLGNHHILLLGHHAEQLKSLL